MAGMADAASASEVTIVNGTNSAIVALQVKPATRPRAEWIPLSKGRPLGIQGTVQFILEPNVCLYDVQAVFADGRSMNKMHQPFCELKRASYIIRG